MEAFFLHLVNRSTLVYSETYIRNILQYILALK